MPLPTAFEQMAPHMFAIAPSTTTCKRWCCAAIWSDRRVGPPQTSSESCTAGTRLSLPVRRAALRSFAGAQIRNTASVGGNIVTGSPISDVNPLYMAMGATFTVEGKGTEPRQIAANDFFLGYRCATPSVHDSCWSVGSTRQSCSATPAHLAYAWAATQHSTPIM